MDYNKIGKFIAAERKAKKLTQKKLADILYVSEKTVSKWETGNGVPDTNSLQKLCEILDVSVNELLNGERLSNDQYVDKAEKQILNLQHAKRQADKHLLTMEIVIGVLSIILMLSLTMIAALFNIPNWQRIVLIIVGFVPAIVGVCFALKIEQVAGFYVCKHCGYKYVPAYKQVLFAPHINRTRYMKCPHCHQKSWHKKVID